MPQSLLHSVPFTDNSLFCDGNNPGKPFCIALLSFAPAFLGYDWILCCRKFIITFGSTDLIIKQLLALAECRLPMLSFRAWQILHPFLSKFRQILLGNTDQCFFDKDAFVRVFPLTIRQFETRLFKKCGNFSSFRPPRGMKLGKQQVNARL